MATKKARKPSRRPRRPETPEGPPEPKPVAAPPSGPFLQMAFFCEKVLHEADGVVSFIRQVDRITRTATGPGAPSEMPQGTYAAFLAIVIKAGGARGRSEIKLIRERPSGVRDTEPVFALTVHFEGEERGQGIYGPITIALEEEGLYWFDLFVDDTLMTRMPLRIIYQRATTRSR